MTVQLACSIICVFYLCLAPFLFWQFKRIKKAAHALGRTEGFNLAYFNLIEIVLYNYQIDPKGGFNTFRKIMIESETVLKAFYPGMKLDQTVAQAFDKIEAEYKATTPSPFPNPGSTTIN